SIYAYPVPIEDDEAAIRAALWAATDSEVKRAQKRFTEVKGNRSVLAKEEDSSADFSREKPVSYHGAPIGLSVDRAGWEERARAASRIFRSDPTIESGSCSFTASRIRRTYANSEGTRIQDDSTHYRYSLSANTTCEDGMALWLYESAEVPDASAFPDEA